MLNIVFFCIVFIFVGLFSSKMKIRIEKIELNINNVNFKFRIGIFLFSFLRILELKCDKNGVKIFGRNFSYKRIFNIDLKELVVKILKNRDKNKQNKLNFKIDLAKFTLKVGTEDMFITVFLVTLLSGLFTEFLKNKMKKINNRKIAYKVLPEFNRTEFFYEGKMDISIKTIDLKSLIFKKQIKIKDT